MKIYNVYLLPFVGPIVFMLFVKLVFAMFGVSVNTEGLVVSFIASSVVSWGTFFICLAEDTLDCLGSFTIGKEKDENR